LPKRIGKFRTKESKTLAFAGTLQIESAHRHIVQQRLKRAGTWWRAAKAEHLLALRLNRANRQWDACWAANSTNSRHAA
jgi:hypothetical protein